MLVEEHCPTTCDLMMHTRGCGSGGLGVMVEKCVDGEWAEVVCILEPICTKGCDYLDKEERASKLRSAIENVSDINQLKDFGSSRYLALQWIASQDGKRLCPGDETLFQRYILALLFFHMGGEGWLLKNLEYMNPNSECEWFGVVCENGYVIELNFQEINLTGEIPSEIGSLRTLEKIALDGNFIEGKIPESIGNLTYLTHLDLDRNLITGVIPDSIFQLEKLEWLDIDSNRLQGTLSYKIATFSSLQLLSLFNNTFSGTIPKSLSKMYSLRDLVLDANNFSGEISEEICKLGDGNLNYLSADCGKIKCSCCTDCY